MFAIALYFLLHFNFIQYPNNLLCISMHLNALYLAFDHINWSVAYYKYSFIRMLLVNPA